jgi:hypothetical protein
MLYKDTVQIQQNYLGKIFDLIAPAEADENKLLAPSIFSMNRYMFLI